MKALSLVAYLSFVLERMSQALQARPRPILGQIRQVGNPRPQLRLELVYHPAKALEGYVLIPKDQYFQDAEALLERL